MRIFTFRTWTKSIYRQEHYWFCLTQTRILRVSESIYSHHALVLLWEELAPHIRWILVSLGTNFRFLKVQRVILGIFRRPVLNELGPSSSLWLASQAVWSVLSSFFLLSDQRSSLRGPNTSSLALSRGSQALSKCSNAQKISQLGYSSVVTTWSTKRSWTVAFRSVSWSLRAAFWMLPTSLWSATAWKHCGY